MDKAQKNRNGREFNVYGFILIITSFVLRFLTIGIFQCLGIIIRELAGLYDIGKGELNWIPSVSYGCMLFLGPLSGVIDSKIGSRRTILLGTLLAGVGLATCMVVPNVYYLYLTYGVITGSGYSLVFHAATVPINLYFHKRRALANSLANLGSGLGTTIMPLLLTLLLEFYGWRGTFLILSGMFLQSFVCGMLIRPIEKQDKHSKLLPTPEEVKRKPTIWKQTKMVLKNVHFMMYTISALCVMSVYGVPFLTLPIMMASFGYSPQQQATIIMSSGIANLIQRPFIGVLVDKVKSYTLATMGVAAIVMGGVTFGVAFIRHYPLFIFYGVIFGMGSGTYTNLQPVALLDVIDRECYSLGLGYFRLFIGIGISLGPPIAGWITDARGLYDWAFYYTGILFTLGGILLITLNILMRCRHKRSKDLDPEDELEVTERKTEDDKHLYMGSTLSLS